MGEKKVPSQDSPDLNGRCAETTVAGGAAPDIRCGRVWMGFAIAAIALLLATLLSSILAQVKCTRLARKVEAVDRLNADLIAGLQEPLRSEAQEHLAALQNALQAEFERSMASFQNGLNARTTKSLADAQEQIREHFSKQVSAVEKAASQVIAESESRLLRDERAAELAYAQAKVHVQANELDQARLYFLNAINHCPGDIKYLSGFVDFVKSGQVSDLDAVNQARSVVELALYQLPPQSLPPAIVLLEALAAKGMELEMAEREKERIDWVAEFARLQKTPLSQICLSPAEVATRRDELYVILRGIEGSDVAAEKKMVVAVQEEATAAERIYPLSFAASRMATYVDLLKKESDYSSQRASARFMAASSLLSEFWNEDMDDLPPALARRVKDVEGALSTYQTKIAEAKAEPICKHLKAEIETALGATDSSYQKRLEGLHKAMQTVAEKTGGIPPEVLSKQLKSTFAKVQEREVEWRRKQYLAYQRWAVDICVKGMVAYNQTRVFTDNDAKRVFKEIGLAKIDVRLITPEVSRCYNAILQKITGELPGSSAFVIDRELSLAKKKALEDF